MWPVVWQVVKNVQSALARRPQSGSEREDEGVLPMSMTAGQSRVLFPDEFLEDSPPSAVPGRPGLGRALRVGGYGAVTLLVGVGLLRLGSAIGSPAPRSTAVASGEAPMVSPQIRMDLLADTLALATGAFDLRIRLFQTHQMQCADLARGLVLVEERWIAYNAARAATGVARDSARSALDRTLYASVDATERQFEQSKCPRP